MAQKRIYILALTIALICIIGLGSLLPNKPAYTHFYGTIFENFTPSTIVTARYIEEQQKIENILNIKQSNQSIFSPQSQTYFIQLVIKEDSQNEVIINLKRKNNRIDIDLNGLNSQNDVSFSENGLTLSKIKTDWSGKLVTTQTINKNLCLSFESKMVCHGKFKKQIGARQS